MSGRDSTPVEKQQLVALGPETLDEKKLREWGDTQEQGNIERLEEGAKAIVQLVTGLYGVLFAILAFSANPTPTYLHDPAVRWLGTVALPALFLALLAGLVAIYPFRATFTTDNLTSLKAARDRVVHRKALALGLTFLLFLVGMGSLGALVLRVLWIL